MSLPRIVINYKLPTFRNQVSWSSSTPQPTFIDSATTAGPSLMANATHFHHCHFRYFPYAYMLHSAIKLTIMTGPAEVSILTQSQPFCMPCEWFCGIPWHSISEIAFLVKPFSELFPCWFPVPGEGWSSAPVRKGHFSWKTWLTLGIKGEGRQEGSLASAITQCCELKIISLPKQYISQWPIPNPSNSQSACQNDEDWKLRPALNLYT